MIFPGIDTSRYETWISASISCAAPSRLSRLLIYATANLRESPTLGDSLFSGRLQLISRNYENREILIARMRIAEIMRRDKTTYTWFSLQDRSTMRGDWLRSMKCQLTIASLTESKTPVDRDARRHNVKAIAAPLYAAAEKRNDESFCVKRMTRDLFDRS